MFLVQIERAKEMYVKDPERKSFTFMHCWNKLKLEQKWADLGCETSQKKTRRPQLQVQGHVHLELMKISMLMKRRDQVIHHQGKEGQARRFGNSNSQGEGLYMEAMEKLWAKREKAEEMREIKKKERNDERLAVETRRLEIKQQVAYRKLDLMQREIELKQREDDEKVMNMDLNGMSERQKIFYKTLQNEIIARRCGGGN